MSYFIIIRGPLGSGKTTIAKQLAEELPAFYVPVDTILEEHRLDKVEPNAEGISVENFIKADDIVFSEVKEKLQGGQNVIFDGCFYYREVIEDLIKKLPYPYFVFTLKAPVEVCIARDKARAKGHGEDAARAVHNLVSRFDYGVNINARQSVRKSVRTIRNFIETHSP